MVHGAQSWWREATAQRAQSVDRMQRLHRTAQHVVSPPPPPAPLSAAAATLQPAVSADELGFDSCRVRVHTVSDAS